ncbi:MAG TPA: OmpH family outer membrane protein [Alphaproteobacteria bacterium]|nr:OmpH family outer membrane protein [Alphaproteobacteria bacterium]
MRSFISVLGLALAGTLALGSGAFAQTPAAAPAAAPALVAPTIGIVDLQKIMQESAAGRSIQGQLETEARKIRDQLTKVGEELKTAENDLKRQRPVLQPDAFQERSQDLQRRYANAQQLQQERQEAFAKATNDARNVVVDNVLSIVQQLAAERRIGLVLQRQAVLTLSDKNMDITDDVIQRLNTKLPSVTVTVAPPGAANTAAAAAGSATDGIPAPAPAATTAPAKKK